jgi:hypothetical protein
VPVRALAAALVLTWLGPGCHEHQELFPEPDASAEQPRIDASSGAPEPSTVLHLISIGADAQTDGLGVINGLGATIILRNDTLLFWGNGGEQTDGRGIVVAVIDPKSGMPTDAPQSFDTWETRNDGATETARLVAFLEEVEPGMLVLLAVGDDAGLTDNGTPEVRCDLLEDDDTQRLLSLLVELGSRRIREYCYRASWAMAAYKGKGVAEQEALVEGAPAHVMVSVP